MEKGAGLPHDDVALTVRAPVTALRALVEAAMTHPGLPAETAACLRQMAVHVAQLHEATAALAAAEGGAKVVDITRLDRPRTALRDLVGADLADRLRPEAGQDGQPAGERPHLLLRLPGDGPRLTPQEQRILDLIGRGHTNRQIATELYLAEKTVKNYVSNMLRKLGMERRTQAAIYATSGDRPHAPTGTAP